MSKTVLETHSLKFRWINAQCFEFKFSNGKTLLTDPYFDFPVEEDGPGSGMRMPCKFTVDDLEGANYVFLNHNHGDHNYNLGDVYDKFHSTVMTHSATAMEVAKAFPNISLTSIYPVDFGDTYYFDGIRIDTYHGTHHAQEMTLSKALSFKGPSGNTGREMVGCMGSVFNMNFVLTTPEGLRIAFLGGDDDGMLERFKTIKPNILIRNKMASSRVLDHVAENFADFFAKSSCQILIPMHYETWLNTRPEFAKSMIEDMNRIMQEKGMIGRVASLERTKWYTLDMNIAEA